MLETARVRIIHELASGVLSAIANGKDEDRLWRGIKQRVEDMHSLVDILSEEEEDKATDSPDSVRCPFCRLPESAGHARHCHLNQEGGK
jgi:hypothetical protein